MGYLDIDIELEEDNYEAKCESTANLFVGLRVIGAVYSQEAIIDGIVDSTTFSVSEKPNVTGSTSVTVRLEEPAFSELVELQIYCKLKSKIKDYAVELFPNNPSQYNLTHPNGAILIHYYGSPFGTMGSGREGSWSQERELVYQVYLISRNLRSNAGIQRKLEEVRMCLSGLIPTWCKSHLYQTDESFVAEYAGEWHYGMWFKTKTSQVIGEH